MRMANRKLYLVDTENVGSAWKELLPQRGSKDVIILFFTEHSPGISYCDLDIIRRYPSSFDMIECTPGKNGLDFQLVSYLGYLIKSAPKTDYIIVTNDTGYDAVVKFWSQRGMSVTRRTKSELTAPVQEKDAIEEVKGMLAELLKELLPEGYSLETFVETIYKMVCDYSEKQLQELYAAFRKEYGHEQGTAIYRQMKPQIRTIYKKIPK